MKFNTFFKQDDRELAAKIKAATRVTMGPADRARMRALLSEYTHLRPIRTNVGLATSNRISSFFMRHSMPTVAAVLVLVVGGGTAAAAERALPGDTLYPIKVHVNEEVRATLAVSPKAKADWAVNRAERRPEEAATLALSGKLSDERRADLDTNLAAHVKTAEEHRKRLAEKNDRSKALEIETSIDGIALAREDILDGERVAISAVLAEPSVAAMSAKSARVESQETRRVAIPKGADDSDTKSKGHRTAAKARIEAAKKFLDRSAGELGTTTREKARERLKTAREAFSSGESDEERGDKVEASSNFDSALEAATEIEALISVSHDSNEDSKEDRPNLDL